MRVGAGSPTVVIAPADPTLDDMLAAMIVTSQLERRPLPEGIAAFARYAGLVREGLIPGKVPFETSLAGIYLAIRRDAPNQNLRDESAARRFLNDWARLERAILQSAERGENPASDDFLARNFEFERERAFLQRDHEVFELDLACGEEWPAHLPGGPADGFCLMLREPKSILFKLWHRVYTEAAEAKRYVLLAVRDGPGRWVFSTDPIYRFSLKPLADRLQEMEVGVDAEGAADDPWFDGARFAHSMIASPHRGTKLDEQQLLDAVRRWASGTSDESEVAEPAEISAIVDARADEFERQLKAGKRPDIADVIADAPAAARKSLLEECLLLDTEYRVQQGKAPTFEDYLRKYPRLRQTMEPMRSKWEQSLGRLETITTKKTEAGKHPKTIRRYVIIEKLPRSGQAELFRAVDPELRREVLIKWYLQSKEASNSSAEAFANEAAVLAELNHRNLARIFGLDRYKDRPFLVMEYIIGMNLRQYAAAKPLEPRRIARLVAQVARAAAYAHERSVFHFDIKPDNILVDRSGQAKLIDFGLARIQSAWGDHPSSGILFGTPGYMPPEQAGGQADRLGAASDTFALGGVLYFLLTGKAPFDAATADQRIELTRKCEWGRELLDQANAPAGIKLICAKALSAEPKERYTADELASALGKLARDREIG